MSEGSRKRMLMKQSRKFAAALDCNCIICQSLLWVHLARQFDKTFCWTQICLTLRLPNRVWQGMTMPDCLTLCGAHWFGRTDTVKFHCPVGRHRYLRGWTEFWPGRQIRQMWSEAGMSEEACALPCGGQQEACGMPCAAGIIQSCQLCWLLFATGHCTRSAAARLLCSLALASFITAASLQWSLQVCKSGKVPQSIAPDLWQRVFSLLMDNLDYLAWGNTKNLTNLAVVSLWIFHQITRLQITLNRDTIWNSTLYIQCTMG